MANGGKPQPNFRKLARDMSSEKRRTWKRIVFVMAIILFVLSCGAVIYTHRNISSSHPSSSKGHPPKAVFPITEHPIIKRSRSLSSHSRSAKSSTKPSTVTWRTSSQGAGGMLSRLSNRISLRTFIVVVVIVAIAVTAVGVTASFLVAGASDSPQNANRNDPKDGTGGGQMVVQGDGSKIGAGGAIGIALAVIIAAGVLLAVVATSHSRHLASRRNGGLGTNHGARSAAKSVTPGYFQIPPIPSLENLGNTCYLGSVVQALAWVLPDISFFSGDYRDGNNEDILLSLFVDVVVDLQHRKYPNSYETFVYLFNEVSRNFEFEQGDCTSVLDVLGSFPLGGASITGGNRRDAIFASLAIKLGSRVRCQHCGGTSIDVSPRLYYSLTISSEVIDVQRALNAGMTVWKDGGVYNLDCQDCQAKCPFAAMETIDHCGTVFALSVRKVYGGDGRVSWTVPLGALFIGNRHFARLVAAVVHRGTALSGHYIACLWDAELNRWMIVGGNGHVEVSEGVPEYLTDVANYSVALAFYK